MKSVSINGIARVNLGKPFAKQLRKEENIPCVIYGGMETPIHFYAHTNEFRKIIYTPEVFLININIGEETIKTTMGDIQFHPVTDQVLHIDFLRVFEDKKVRINIPVSIQGNAIGVRNGGRLASNLRRLMVSGLSKYLPETIEIDISPLKIGDAIRVKDLKIENIDFLNNSDDVIVAIKTARAAIVDDEEEAEDAAADSSGSPAADSSENASTEKSTESGE